MWRRRFPHDETVQVVHAPVGEIDVFRLGFVKSAAKPANEVPGAEWNRWTVAGGNRFRSGAVAQFRLMSACKRMSLQQVQCCGCMS